MTKQHPTDLLTAAAQRIREGDHRIDIALRGPLAAWLDVYAERFKIWRGPHVSAELGHALDVAYAVLGQDAA
ncbi:hypothetical protein ACFC1T_17075 [Kitasatospora sp. NPDC056076]|uniref:hypothetical protein n=1 Tax=Streptomycetaceae TaxID=2062 RepID=UPI0035DEFADA